MKIRSGFVSNSSSSSFIVYGISLDNGDDTWGKMPKVYEALGIELPKDFDEMREEGDWYNVSLGGSIEIVNDYEGDNLYIGIHRNPECLDVDEALNGFVTDEDRDLVERIAKVLDERIDVHGGTMYC